MGAANVKAVFGVWNQLPDLPFRQLVFMAVTAKDDDEPPVYWGSQETLAVALGREWPAGDSQEARKVRGATERAIKRGRRDLVEAGALWRSRRAAPGRTACYALNLRTLNGGQSLSPVSALTGDSHRPNGGHSLSLTGDTHCPPEEYLGIQGSSLSRAGEDSDPSAGEPRDDRFFSDETNNNPADAAVVAEVCSRMGWDESAAKAVVTTIRLEHAPRNVRAYVRACRDDDLAALKPQPKQWHHVPVKEWPPWCGECENAVDRFVDVEDGRVARCPRCHPAVAS
jgi:hypothetical protein